MTRATFAAALDPQRNALNLLRLLLAVAVIVAHARRLGGFADQQWGGWSLGSWAVAGFFAISGYLITRSADRRDVVEFALARALRIFPGLWVCVLVCVFVLAPTIGLVTGGDWVAGDAGVFALHAMALDNNGGGTVGTVLTGNPRPGLNGALWTLGVEVSCYLVTGLAALAPAFPGRRWVLIGALGAVSALLVVQGDSSAVTLRLVPFYLAGAVLYRFADVVPCRASLALFAAVALVFVVRAGSAWSLSAVPVAYLVLWAGARLPDRVKALGSVNDYSYGMYVYAFPLQQLLVALGVAAAGLGAFAVASVAVTVPFAVASWWLVERPAMRLGKWVRGRRLTAAGYASPTREQVRAT